MCKIELIKSSIIGNKYNNWIEFDNDMTQLGCCSNENVDWNEIFEDGCINYIIDSSAEESDDILVSIELNNQNKIVVTGIE